MASKKGANVPTAADILSEAIKNSGDKLSSVGQAMGFKSHSAIWQYCKGTTGIPISTAIKLGLAAGMTHEQAQEFFLINMRERDPELYAAVTTVINSAIAARG